MRFIKPYGISETRDKKSGQGRQRVLVLKPASTESKEGTKFSNFACTNDKLQISMWISTIDKIVNKPSCSTPKGKNEKLQKALREKLGRAAWGIIKDKVPAIRDKWNEEKWNEKLHRYPKNAGSKKAKIEGRYWYRFTSKEPEDVNTDNEEINRVAHKIYRHLYEHEIPTNGKEREGKEKEKRKGRIDSVVLAIERNIHKEKGEEELELGWDSSHEDTYRQTIGTDLAYDIRTNAVKAGKNDTDKGKVSYSSIVSDHFAPAYGKIFKDSDGTVYNIQQAKENFPELFALHSAIKAFYRNICKNKKCSAQCLPRCWSELMKQMEYRDNNRKVSDLIRLGRIIHYQAGEDGEKSVVDWICKKDSAAKLLNSPFWLSAGQTQIKRHEAFVRVWRNIIALGGQTLYGWAGRAAGIQDILRGAKVTLEKFDNSAYLRYLPILFGENSTLLEQENEGKNKEVFRMALKGWSDLRNRSFHFRTLKDFVSAFHDNACDKQTAETCDKQTAKNKEKHEAQTQAQTQVLDDLWCKDFASRGEKLKSILRGCYFEHFVTEEQARGYIEHCVSASPSGLALPRFARVLTRANNAWKRGKFTLHFPAKYRQDEYTTNPLLRCQYTGLKVLYDRAFPQWLKDQKAEGRIKGWIDRALERTTKAAQSINKKSGEDITANVGKQIDFAHDIGIDQFMHQLTAATATAMQVQNAYKSNADRAREQAKCINDLACDVLAQAFECFIQEKGLSWLVGLSSKKGSPKKEKPTPFLDTIRVGGQGNGHADGWMKRLYFLIHLVPSDEISMLYHQLKKFDVLVKKIDVREENADMRCLIDGLFKVFSLYLEMHNAQFIGLKPVPPESVDTAREWFKPRELFDTVFPQETQPNAPVDAPVNVDSPRVPLHRSLREIERVGVVPILTSIFKNNPVSKEHFDTFDKMEKDIAQKQAKLADLHEKLSISRGKTGDTEKTDYKKILQYVCEYRHVKNHVHLVNHVRLHHLLMRVLGRLADYSGIWERDLYFVMLALLYRKGIRNREGLFEKGGIKNLRNGQIVNALYALKEKEIKEEIDAIFFNHSGSTEYTDLRNNFAHFNMTRNTETINLTHEVNKARRLVAYDRKLKNAVSKSIIDILGREGMVLKWKMLKHQLNGGTVHSKTIRHLKNIKGVKGGPLEEKQQNKDYVAMVAALFHVESSE